MKIVGFGACMIDGTPFEKEKSFFQHAITLLQTNYGADVTAETISLGGFPAPRAAKHLQKKVLDLNPDIVVLQFGSTDTAVPIRKHIGRIGGSATKNTGRDITWIDSVKWLGRSIVAEIFRVPPVTQQAAYVDAILSMARDIRERGAIAVVISPFVFGSSRGNRFARKYSDALEKLLSREAGIHFLNAHRDLSKFSKSRTLLQDGFHISKEAHKAIGVKLGHFLADVSKLTSKGGEAKNRLFAITRKLTGSLKSFGRPS